MSKPVHVPGYRQHLCSLPQPHCFGLGSWMILGLPSHDNVHDLQLEFGNVDFLDTHGLRQRLSDNASRVRTRVQQVDNVTSSAWAQE